jgi:hypothetical protein
VASGVQISTLSVSTPDGRVLTIDRADVLDGFPVLVQAGSPGSRRMLPLAIAQYPAQVQQDHGSIHDGQLAEACDWLRRQI